MMGPIAYAILQTIKKSQEDNIIVKLKLQQCSGATIGQDNRELIYECLLGQIREICNQSGKHISLYVEKGKDKKKMFTYKREYADGTKGIGTSSDGCRAYIKYSDGDTSYTFETKNAYNNALADEKARIGVEEQRISISGRSAENVLEEKKAKTLVRQNNAERDIEDYAMSKIPEINRENAADANAEIKAQRTQYDGKTEVDMSKFHISTIDKIIIGCLCVVFPLAIIYYEKLKQNFITETKKKQLQQKVGLKNLNDANQTKQNNIGETPH